jgi:hypothetical protein
MCDHTVLCLKKMDFSVFLLIYLLLFFDDKIKIAVRNSTWNQMNVMNWMEATFLAMEKKYVKVVN